MREWLSVTLIIGLASCGGDSPSAPETPATLQVAVLSPPAKLLVGDTSRLKAQVSYSDGKVLSDVVVTWASSDPTKLTIDANGLLTALSASTGAVTITASYSTASAHVAIAVTGAILDIWPDTNGLIVGQTRALISRHFAYIGGCCIYFHYDTTNATSWISSDTTVAAVDAAGNVTARGVGHARIKVTAPADSVGTAEVFVTAAPSPGLRFVSISAAHGFIKNHTPFGNRYWSRACGLTDGGDVYCWGALQTALIASDPTDRCDYVYGGAGMYHPYRFRCTEVPKRLSSPVKFVSMTLRGERGCGATSAGAVYCWSTSDPPASTDSVLQVTPASGFVGMEMSIFGDPDLLMRSDGVVFFGSVQPSEVSSLKFRSLADGTGCGILTDSSAVCISAAGSAQSTWPGTKWTALTGATVSGGTQLCGLNAAGEVWCGRSTTAPTLKATMPIVQLGAFGRIETFKDYFDGPPCGLTASGDLYCFASSTPQFMNPQGPKLKQFSENCALGIDDRVYCIPVGGTDLRLLPGQR